MTTAFGGESAAIPALPVTGSGPFTIVAGLIGMGAIGVGALMRRVGRPIDPDAAAAGPRLRSLGAAAVTDPTIATDAIAWVEVQLDAPGWVAEQVTAQGIGDLLPDASAWVDQQVAMNG